ncbi:MAG: hypothetical protein EON50_14410 [Acidovorax sp.]|nr:MAG: hypothetical protein EON50_14410 [Acidovorax sp.]
MQPADSAPPPTAGAAADIAERFSARDSAGQQVVIEKLKARALENDLQGLQWSDGGPHYQLQGGGAVDQVGDSTYRIVSTGEVVRREEGQHGLTHHTEHQTAGRP